ncbi:hypothetical protein [Algoriphagus antarcticus]|uniref:Uncharacterized protein n=1 Tax=Algoriphagus antarcticus TaxID=238540 RepID=A0A3E0D6F4_9BACT|nr:hypothetical protein [Algoriphagus antarcticus]REG77511.1 hypothetical protein C8N25_14311 [Algoriphagus antarcticus]
MKETDFTPYVLPSLRRLKIVSSRGIGAMICFLVPEQIGITAVDRLYPLKPKNPI